MNGDRWSRASKTAGSQPTEPHPTASANVIRSNAKSFRQEGSALIGPRLVTQSDLHRPLRLRTKVAFIVVTAAAAGGFLWVHGHGTGALSALGAPSAPSSAGAAQGRVTDEAKAQAVAKLGSATYFRDGGQLGLALEEVRQALALWPDYPEAKQFVAEVAPAATATAAAADAVKAQETETARTQLLAASAEATRAANDPAVKKRSAQPLDIQRIVVDPTGFRGLNVVTDGVIGNVSYQNPGTRNDYMWISLNVPVPGEQFATENIVVRYPGKLDLVKAMHIRAWGVVLGPEEVVQVLTGVKKTVPSVQAYAIESIG